jgi:hypothetical protein
MNYFGHVSVNFIPNENPNVCERMVDLLTDQRRLPHEFARNA